MNTKDIKLFLIKCFMFIFDKMFYVYIKLSKNMVNEGTCSKK